MSSLNMSTNRGGVVFDHVSTNAILADNFVHSCLEVVGEESSKSIKEEDND